MPIRSMPPLNGTLDHYTSHNNPFLEPIFPFEADSTTGVHGPRESIHYWQERLQKLYTITVVLLRAVRTRQGAALPQPVDASRLI